LVVVSTDKLEGAWVTWHWHLFLREIDRTGVIRYSNPKGKKRKKKKVASSNDTLHRSNRLREVIARIGVWHLPFSDRSVIYKRHPSHYYVVPADSKIVDVSQKFHTADTALPRSQNGQELAAANTSHKMLALPAD
jgi:hypothetical protein